MFHGTEMPSFGDIWREMKRDSSGRISPRYIDDALERKFWMHYMHTQGQNGPDRYSLDVWAAVKEILGDNYYSSITEVGPGWGNYTFNLAECCKSLTCVDISPDVLRYIRQTGADHGFTIRTCNTKWEDYTGKPSEVLFAFNCFYRMEDIEECLRKMDRSATRLHIIGMTSGPEQEYLVELHEELGLPIRFHRLDYILLLNVLYQLGIDCNVRMVDVSRDIVFTDLDSAVRKISRRILTDEYDLQAVRRVVRRHLVEGEDGLLHYVHRFKAALIHW
ncbi:MAG: class I SAM-dependent methyltransferase [archaeon]|nr:class I SAM-dependent methyltransferase [archaeon]